MSADAWDEVFNPADGADYFPIAASGAFAAEEASETPLGIIPAAHRAGVRVTVACSRPWPLPGPLRALLRRHQAGPLVVVAGLCQSPA
jgi:hypothetical protein